MSLAILCSGQGRQHANMFALTGEAPEASQLFTHTQTLLGGADPRRLVRDMSADALHANRFGQIICTLQALAAVEALWSSLPAQVVFAGYSVGEVAAWGASGVLDHLTTLDLSARRAEIMDAASAPGDGLLFIRGLPREVIDRLCACHGAGVAIINPQDAYVLGGSRESLQAVAKAALRLRPRRMVFLQVMVASHVKLMSQATAEFRDALKATSISFPPRTGYRLLSGVDGTAVLDGARGLDKLARQISNTVHWAECLQSCVEAGATSFLEMGPGDALSKMARETFPEAASRSLDDFKSLEGVRAWIRSHMET